MTVPSPASAKEIGEFSPSSDAAKKAETLEPEVFQPSAVVPAPAEVVAETKPAVEMRLPDAYAEPISPATVAKFRHLKVYQGHLLVGGQGLQIVLAGVPAREPAPGWQPAVLAVFERQDGMFQHSAALETLDLQSPSGEAQLYPIGVDLGMEKDTKLAFVTLVYGNADPKVPKQTLTWRFDADSETLALVVADFTPVAKGTKSNTPWQLRLTGNHAATVEGKNYWVRAADTDVLALFPYRRMTTKATPAGLEFAATEEAPPVEGLEMLLGRSAVGRALVRSASLEDCLYGTRRPRKPLKEEAKLPWVLGCQANVLKSTLRLNSAAGDSNGGVRPLYLFAGDGTPLLFTALEGTKDSIDLVLPIANGTTYQLADTRAGRLVPGTSMIAPVEGQVRTVEVPSSPSGLVRLIPGRSKAAAILTVRRFDREGGTDVGIVGAGDGDSQVRLAANRLLIRSWPADLELETGGYELTMSRGGEGQICTTHVLVQKNRRIVFDCGNAATTAQKTSADWTFVDLAAAEARDLPLTSLRQALGVDLLAEPLDEASSRPAPLKVLRTEDEATGTTLSFLPATAVLASRWEKQKHSLSHEDQTARFVRLVRGEGGPGLLELGCPAAGTSTFEYELLVQRVQPDAVRLFGCQGEGRQGDLLSLYDKLSANRRAPYLLTSESGLKIPAARAPRLVLRMSPKTALQKPDAAIAAIVAGDYEINAGGSVSLTKVTRTPKTGMVAEVAYDGLSAIPTLLDLYGEKGLIKSEKISAQAGSQGTLSFSLHKVESIWLRAELRSDDGILATTPAVPVSRLLPKEGESH